MLKPALLYFAITFAAGFVLGTIRTLMIAPRVGDVAAVLIECPFMLLASFMVARWVVEHSAHDANAARRLLIGLLAFAMLMSAELLMAWSFNVSPQEYGASLLTTAGMIGLAAQLLFAAMPTFIRPRGMK